MKKPNRPFAHFYEVEDFTKCKNKSCPIRFECRRYMDKPEEWQSYTTYKFTKKGNCESFAPMYVWENANGKKFTLPEIDNDYLKNIIIHCFETAQEVYDENEKHPGQGEGYLASFEWAAQRIEIAREFIKEARRRKIYK